VKRALLAILRCPACKGQLRLEAAETGVEVANGSLVCIACKESYPIADGIPVLLPEGLRQASLGKG
jgi:uncharacterized protein YbaR (Trm112 family)